MKKIIAILLSILTLFCLCACNTEGTQNTDPKGTADSNGTNAPSVTLTTMQAPSSSGSQPTTPETPDEVKVKFIKVGKADCILIRTKDGNVMIDTGEDDDYTKILEELAEKGVTKLDYLILTHFNKNHIGSAPQIIAGVEIGRVFLPDYEKANVYYSQLDAALKAKNITPEKITANSTFALGNVTFELYPATKQYSVNNEECYSLVTKMIHGQNKFLFAGDVMAERLAEIVSSGIDLSADVLKVPNHGVNDVSLSAFVAKVGAKHAVIFCSDKNPEQTAVRNLLTASGATVYVTREGSIAMTSNGTAIVEIKQ